jgi:hypothetical protein
MAVLANGLTPYGLVRIKTVTRLEVGFSARSGPDLRAWLNRLGGRRTEPAADKWVI